MIKAALIDSREPESIQQLSLGDAPTAVATLDYGDVWLTTDDNCLIVIERKTPNDLIQSISDNRIFNQALGMRSKSPYAYVIITGTLYHTREGTVKVANMDTGWKWSSVQGALLSVQEMGVAVVYCKEAEYAETITLLANRKRTEKILPPVTQARLMTEHENILAALPGIGPQRAIDMAAQFPSAAHSLSWLTALNTVSKVAGIGDGTKSKIRKTLGLEGKQELVIIQPEETK